MAGFDAAVGASPFNIAPERNDELLNGVFGGAAWDLEFNTSLDPTLGVFVARPISKIVEVNYAGLASLYLVAKAAWLIARAGMSANWTGKASLATDPGSTVWDARRLADAARTILADRGAQWRAEVAPPVPDAAAKDEEWYVNNVFLGATGWVTLHEIGHIHLGHQGTVSTDVSFSQEHEADLFAANWVLSDLPLEDTRGHFRVFVICVAMFWIAIQDGIKRGSTTHPHAWQRLERLTSAFPREELNPGYEMAAYVLKVIFLAERDIPVADHPEAAFLDHLIEANRLPR